MQVIKIYRDKETVSNESARNMLGLKIWLKDKSKENDAIVKETQVFPLISSP